MINSYISNYTLTLAESVGETDGLSVGPDVGAEETVGGIEAVGRKDGTGETVGLVEIVGMCDT